MSYNSYNYSPYFQQANPNGRSQQSFQTQSQANAPYYRQPQQSVTSSHHYASQQAQHHLPPTSRPGPEVYAEQRFNNTDAAQGGRLHTGSVQQPLGRSHSEVQGYDANAAAYTDTSALGSLAYASELGSGQTRRSAPERTHSPLTGPRLDSAQPHQASATTRTSTVIQPPTFYTSNAHYPTSRSDSRNSGSLQPDRRGITQQLYTGGHQTSESYNIHLQQAQHQAQNHQHSGNGQTHGFSNIAQRESNIAEATPSGSSARRAGQAEVAQQRIPVTEGRPGHYNHTVNQMHYAEPVHQNLPEPTPPIPNDHEDKHSIFAAPQYPTTVDPSQVFNHYENQRRKTAAVTEVLTARKASEAVQSSNEQSSENPPGGTGVATVSDDGAVHASPSERDQIEEEMKTMIERMREYKAKNPTLFSQIWEQVKKGQPPNRASSQAPSAAKEPSEASRSVVDKTAKTSIDLTENGQLPSPSLTTVQHLSAVESPPGRLPDLGRIPAQRRKRYNKKSSQTAGSPQLQDTPIKDSETTASAPPDVSHHRLQDPVQMNLFKETPLNAGLADMSQGNASMRQAMEAFHTASANSTLETAEPKTSIAKPAVLPRPSSSTSSGKTIWPENKKMALATAAKIALTSAAANAGKKISSQDIHRLLDQNPSYTELCENLEARGFVLDRGHFARLLLAAVPDVNPGTPSHNHRPSAELKQQPLSAHSAGFAQSDIEAAEAPRSPGILQMHSTLRDSPHRSFPSEGGRVQASQVSPTPQVKRVQAAMHLYPSGSTSPKPHGRLQKDGLPPHQRTEVRADPATLSGTIEQSLPADVTVSVDGNNLSTLAPGQLSVPAQAVHNPHMPTIAQASAFRDSLQQAQHGQNHSNGANAHVSVAEPQLPYSAPLPSKASTSSGFGVLKLTDTIVPQPHIAPQSAHVDESTKYPFTSTSTAFSHHALPGRWPDSGMLNRDLQPPMNLQHSQINSHRSSLINVAPMYPAPRRDFMPAPSAQYTRRGPPPHALHQQHHQQTIQRSLTKEAMARKRNFSDIVDLTQLSEDEQEQHYAKKSRPSAGSVGKGTPSDGNYPQTSAHTSYSAPTKQAEQVTRDPAVRERLPGKDSAPISRHPTPTANSIVDLSRFQYAAKGQSVQRNLFKMADIVQPMDKKYALRRSTYNAKTIARDVLIAAGHHPKDKPLNWHLFLLEKNFLYVNYNSDLSTFRWDLVDPIEQTDLVSTAIEDADADDEGDLIQTGQGFFDETSMQRHSTQTALTTAGDSEVSVAVQPPRVGKGVNSQTLGRQPRHGDNGIRTRPGDPSLSGRTGHQNSPGSSSEVKGEDTRRRLPSGAISAFANTGISSMPASTTHTSSSGHTDFPRVEVGPSPPHTHRDSLNKLPNETAIKRRGPPPRIGASLSPSTPELKRRGRPPGSKNLMPRKESTPSGSGQISIPSNTHGTDTTPAQPSGLRNAITPSDGIAVVIVTPSRSTDNVSQDPDRSLKAASKQRLQSQPVYRIYKCEWKGCKAELHNLETLRKHVRKLHRGKPNADGIPCLWSNCGMTRRVYDKQIRSKREIHYPHTFSTSALWDEHMDKDHLESTAWALGDGPSTHPSDAEASDYLSDTAGRLVTPVARTTGPPDPLHLPSEAGPTRAYHNVHGNRTERERAQAVLAACEARAASVGPGIDRGGCTMVTPEAREKLVDDAFAMSVVDAEDDVPSLPGETPQGKGK